MGLQVRIHNPATGPASARSRKWKPMHSKSYGVDLQFDSTIDGKAIKIASMIDEHPGCR